MSIHIWHNAFDRSYQYMVREPLYFVVSLGNDRGLIQNAEQQEYSR